MDDDSNISPQPTPPHVAATEEPNLLDQAVGYVKQKWDQGGENIHNALEGAHHGNYAPLQDMATQTAMGTIGSTPPTAAEFAAMELKPQAAGILDKVLTKIGLTRDAHPDKVVQIMNHAYEQGHLSPQELQGATNALKPPASRGGYAEGGDVVAEAPQVAVPQQEAPPQSQPSIPPTGVPVYDISGPQPVLGHVPHDQVQDALATGRYSLPQGAQIPVFSPDGQLGHVPSEQAQDAFQSGYRYATPDAIDEHKHSGVKQQALAAVEGVASGVLSKPIAHGIETATGLTTTHDINARERIHPWTSGLGETAGLVGSTLTGVGEGRLLADAGELAAKVLGPKGTGWMAKIGARSISDAAQMALYQSGNEVSKMIENDPEQTAGTAAADIGLSTLLGAGIGGAFGAVSPLWKATVGDHVGKLVEDFKGRMSFLKDNPDLQEALTKELTEHHGAVTSAADEVYGAKGLKAQGISKAMPEMHEGISNQAQGISDQLQERLAKMQSDPYSYPPRLTSKLQADSDAFMSKVTHPDATPNDVFNATQDLKQQLQGYSKFEKMLSPVDEGYDFVKDSKQMAHDLRTGLEDTKVWGKAGELQQKINKAFSEYLPTLKDFQSRFMTKVAGEHQVDAGKINTYLNQLGKPNATVKQEMLKNFLEASEKYKSVISDAHAALGNESPIKTSSLAVAHDSLGKSTTGAKLADYFVKRGAAHLAGEGLGTVVGAGLGGLAGHPAIGALIGEKALGPFFSSVLPALAKPILEKSSNSAGLKAAIDYGMAAARGEASINRAAKALFKGAGMVGTNAALEALTPSESKRAKLHAQIEQLQSNPSALTSVGNQVGHYLPAHGAALATQTATAVNYLTSLKPNTAPKFPLDSKLPANPVQQARYNRALDVANDPLLVVQSIHRGNLTPTDVMTLKTVNPGAYKQLSQSLTAEMTNHISKGETVPYKTRINLSVLLGQPLDSSMTSASILAAQPKPQQNQPPTPTTPANRPKTSTSKLGKIASNTQTIGQSREARGVSKTS